MATWFTADLHLGHANIIQFCQRPFADLSEMHDRLVQEWTNRVGQGDDVYFLGDLIAGKVDDDGKRAVRKTFMSLPGRKHLVWGNHDKPWIKNELPWASTQESLDKTVDGQRFYMHHYPMITFPGSRHGAIQLFGHVHNNWKGTRNSVNVGCDVWDFRPVSAAEIVERARDLPVNPVWDELEPGCAL